MKETVKDWGLKIIKNKVVFGMQKIFYGMIGVIKQ